MLIPNLNKNQIVIMDNASIHKSPKIREAIEKAGCKLVYQPPYSPDLNPIEHFWALTQINSDLESKLLLWNAQEANEVLRIGWKNAGFWAFKTEWESVRNGCSELFTGSADYSRKNPRGVNNLR